MICLVIYIIVWLWNLLYVLVEIPSLMRMRDFYRRVLEIEDVRAPPPMCARAYGIRGQPR